HVKRGRDTKIPQSSGLPVKVGDEAVHKELGDRIERAATTASSLEVEQDSALVDKKRVIITESNIRSDLHLADAGGNDCLQTATIFEELCQIHCMGLAKPKAVTTAATTTTTRPNARGVIVQEPSEFRTTTSSLQASQPSKTKEKGKAIMIEPEVPLKRKDQVALEEEMARNLEAQLQAELIEEEKMARKKEEEANISLIESWENTQAMMKADRLLAERLQTRKQKELIDEDKAKLFMEFIERRRKHFAALRVQEKRNKPPTKA
ncbi:hypothetical protein Tco_0625945, partial [Tanacetum coccineum]